MRMRRNILLVLVVMVFLMGPIASRVFVHFDDAATEITKAEFEGRDYTKRPSLSWKTVSDGSFQKQANQWIADRVPNRNSVLLANAGLQRSSIEIANAVCNYPAYPTFYGSSYAAVPDAGAVYTIPHVKSRYDDATLDRCGAWMTSIVEAAPDATWGFALAEHNAIAEANPASPLLSNPVTWDHIAGGLRERLPEDVTVFDMSHPDLESYQRAFFETDHHWQITGALKAYYDVIEMAGKEPIEFGEPVQAIPEPFYGSSDRVGLYPDASDTFYDVPFERSEVTVYINGVSRGAAGLGGIGARDTYVKGPFKYRDLYGSWYHGNYGLTEIANKELPEEAGTLLIVGDSYARCLDHVFAENFKHVYDVDPRYFEKDIAEYVAEIDPDVAVFIIGVNTLTEVTK